MSTDENYRNLGTLLTVAGGLSFVSAIFSGFSRRMTIAANLLFFSGVLLVLGIRKFAKFLSQPKRILGSIIFLVGFLCVLGGRNWTGGLMEIIGVLTIFGGFVPRLMNTLQKVPYIGKYFRFALPTRLYPTPEELPL
jgi:hypothetical protein